MALPERDASPSCRRLRSSALWAQLLAPAAIVLGEGRGRYDVVLALPIARAFVIGGEPERVDPSARDRRGLVSLDDP